jgi:hypothetical protein
VTYVCTKCGYHGAERSPHLAPRGSGQLCHYEPFQVATCVCGHDISQHVVSGPAHGRCVATDKLGFACCRCEAFDDRDVDNTSERSKP